MSTGGWRQCILSQVQTHQQTHVEPFVTIFKSYVELTDSLIDLKSQISSNRIRIDDNLLNPALREETEALKKQNSTLIEELTGAKALLDANAKLQAREIEVTSLQKEVKILNSRIAEMQAANDALTAKVADLERTIDFQANEHIALQATFTAVEAKYRKCQDENSSLIERWRELKQREIDEINKENEKATRMRDKKLEKDLREAASFKIPEFDTEKFQLLDGGPCSPGAQTLPNICVASCVPSRAAMVFDGHDGEIECIKWAPSGRTFATGGADRRLKLWEIGNNGKQKCTGMLSGCNQSVMDIEFDQNSEHILASSNDNVVRIWDVLHKRLRHTFTGHGNKVHAAKYIPGGTAGGAAVVSGSHDRTLKLWDIRTDACVRSVFAMSICNDLLATDGPGANIISAHFDKKLRFWDVRTASKQETQAIVMPDKITSIRLSSDGWNILASCRDDVLYYYDLRGSRVVNSFTADGLRLSHDHTRAALAPDDQFCAVGSSDGTIYVWSTLTGVLQRELKRHEASVMDLSWDPSGRSIVSVDREHKVVVWSDY